MCLGTLDQFCFFFPFLGGGARAVGIFIGGFIGGFMWWFSSILLMVLYVVT